MPETIDEGDLADEEKSEGEEADEKDLEEAPWLT